MRFRAVGFLTLAFMLQQVGCPLVDSKVVQAFREYFPNASCSHPMPDTLMLETNLAGSLSPLLCEQLFQKFAAERDKFDQLKKGFEFANYRWLCIGLADMVVAWDKTRENQFWVLTRQEFSSPGWWDFVRPRMMGDLPVSATVVSSLQQQPANALTPKQQTSQKAFEFMEATANAIADARKPKPVDLMTGSFQIRPRHYQYVPFQVPPDRSVHVGGNFTVQGGAGNDIEAFICSEQDFFRFQNHQGKINPGWFSGRVSNAQISVRMPPGSYYLVFSNMFSTVSTKLVTSRISIINIP